MDEELRKSVMRDPPKLEESTEEILKKKSEQKPKCNVVYHKPKKCDKYRFHHENEVEGVSVFTAIADCTDEQRLKFCEPDKITKEGKLIQSGITVEEIKQKIREREEMAEQYPYLKKQMEVILQRDEKIVEHAKKLEKENESLRNEFDTYKDKTEERFNKLATLVAQLMK